jgi:hypothetical protein
MRIALLEKVEILQNMLVAEATGREGGTNEEYQELRNELLQDPSIKSLLPRFVTTCRDLSQFWSFIKRQASTYQERREFLWDAFSPLIEKLESDPVSPVDQDALSLLENLDADHVHAIWQKALERRQTDPEGAITMARTLLEAVCKTILDETGEEYPDKADLPKLYSLTAERLNLAPSQHTEQVFKQILGGCKSVVDGLGSIRNKLGDAHGQGKQPVKPAARHAELAVNLAGTMATFLIRTWEQQKEKA